jgi:hypothetical protein
VKQGEAAAGEVRSSQEPVQEVVPLIVLRAGEIMRKQVVLLQTRHRARHFGKQDRAGAGQGQATAGTQEEQAAKMAIKDKEGETLTDRNLSPR